MTNDQKLHMLIGAYAVQIIVLETRLEQVTAELEQRKKADAPSPVEPTPPPDLA